MPRKLGARARSGRSHAVSAAARATPRPNTPPGASPERIAALEAELKAVSDELEALSYSISHDLRAPLRHIDGFLGLLRDELDTPGPKAEHYMATAAGAARRMSALLDDLLAYSRTARLPLEPRRTDLGRLVRDLVARYDQGVGAPRVRWEIGELPWVMADGLQLRTVLQHLLSNARKFTRGTAEPRVEVRARAGRRGETEISVRDNGIGFDPQHAGRLFGVFQRLHGEERFEGNGIGLAIARRILHRHGQRIWADAAPGEGAVFTFTLALAQGV